MNIEELLKGEITQNELLDYYNTSIIYEKLPRSVRGFVFNYDNVNFIIINDNLSYYKKKRTILHELAHIELNQLNQIDKDLFDFKVDSYEDEADLYLKEIMEGIRYEQEK